ncbi:glycogen debranching protein GlgX [Anaeromyxobacter sp. Fw109-5]|uniref:glycogen debranching protein GlgX n=1 Tax=Anaeromyxobacter sp. (strain Fw109-5) TaxID=404589 RepID=UPI0000ED8AC1|nr:glycogen debranching protein GlgX [Anaeromyxobacter sp. Fw109-5]ABS27500.1 glycogen debranching enzyme GlgX [Anaeromyxobacter sp. Fw109-5]
MHARATWPGRPEPLGATFDGHGVNFAVYSPQATRVEVCVFDPDAPARETRRFELREKTAHVWHAYSPGLQTGTLYGFRAHGPYEPTRGLRFNGSKLLVDPYARALTGEVDWRAPVHSYPVGDPGGDLGADVQDDAWGVPKAVVVADLFDWGGDTRPLTPWHRSVIYEVHVRGFTMRHPGVPPELRGTYAGLASPEAIAHLRRLGITAVELLPVHEFVDDAHLVEKGLKNYWGYNTLCYFAPEQRYSSLGSRGGQVTDFKEMVKALHRAGIEVIVDVVYNHTCEGNHLGPTLSLKGLANDDYYRLSAADRRYYVDFTGCGNSLDTTNPQTLKLVMDSLRYWAEQLHVDGFRFDLATTLCRDPEHFDPRSGFLQAVHQDPTLAKMKLIAEPWDLGPGGYAVGRFPVRWSEWNGRYRDVVRRFWKGEQGQAPELGYRLTGSADLYEAAGRKIFASVNFVTAHDGFTLRDLVSYERKHNEANLEGNRDGSDDNASWNCGAEGETDDPLVKELRDRQQRNLIAALFVSQGVPMLCAGDEMGKTQRGNNNAYCQDNEISWLDWDLDGRRQTLLDFTAHMIRLRLREPVLQRRRFFRGARLWDSSLKDLAWFRPDGREMREADWQVFVRSLAFLLGGDAIDTPDERGIRIVGDTLLVLLNAHHELVAYTLPDVSWGAEWEILVDTAGAIDAKRPRVAAQRVVEVAARSLVVLSRPAAR